MTDDTPLLRRYAEEKSEEAFAELVRRQVDFVYGAALRQTRGNAALAQEVTQAVFTDLARKAGRLGRHEVLVGWLHTATRFAAGKAMRAESRRRVREREAGVMNEILREENGAAEWERLRPVIDEALGELKERERVAVLLRFFEKKPLADVGAALALTETAARSCVDRALDKLHAALARRGIVSTSAALGVALGNQVNAAAPAGLSASVAGAALAEAALGGGLAASLASIGLMSTAKIAGVAAVALALALSLATNAYLLLTSPAEEQRLAVAKGPIASSTPATDTALAALTRGDFAALRDRLRADGASEATVRGVIEGVLRRRYREKLSAQRAELMQHSWWSDSSWWWQGGRTGGPPAWTDDAKMLREMVLDPLDRLFGPDPAEVAEQEARFEFLAADKRQGFVALERDFDAAKARFTGAEQNGPVYAELKRVHDEQERQLLAGLSPAERTEYNLHFSPTAVALRERMSQIVASEQEYRAIMGVVTSPDNNSRATSNGQNYRERDQRGLDQVVAALGYDRGLDYVWAGAWEYPSYARVAQDAGLPPSTAGRVLQLAAESINRAITIHDDAALTPEEKRAAMVALQQQVRPQLDALLPPEQQQRLAAETLTWFTALGQGRYKVIPTSAAGTTGSIISPGTTSVETPAPANRVSRQYVARRPGGG